MNGVYVVAGLVVVAVTLADAFDTLVSTRIRTGRWWPTDVYYRTTWKLWRRMCSSIPKLSRREAALSLFGPLSLIGLLVGWTVGQVGGWSLVWWGARQGFSLDFVAFNDAVYYSGVVYLTIGFGDILPADGALRLLSPIEALGGLGTLGLVIGFLPSLYSGYQDRESQLLRLDD
ncbi:MAG: ion channel, partial [Candidatus Methylomirabilales bacterium]